MPPGASRLPMIDALRGYAIAFVFAVHVIGPLVPWELGLFRIGGLPFSPLMPLHAGIYAVQLFFVLSGFVLYLPYAQGRRQMRSGRDVREYLWRRCTRLMPLFWLAVLVPMVLMFGWQPLHDRVGQLVPMLTMTFPFFQKTFYPQYNFTLWSLGIEFWLSLSLPLVVPLVRRFGIGRVVLGVILLSLCTRFAAMLTVRTFGFNVLMSGPFSQLDTFVFGVALAHLWVHPVASPKPLRDLLAGCTMLVIAGFMTDWVNLHVVPWGSSALTRLLVAAGMALMTHGLLWLDWKAIANPVARQAGRMCYSPLRVARPRAGVAASRRGRPHRAGAVRVRGGAHRGGHAQLPLRGIRPRRGREQPVRFPPAAPQNAASREGDGVVAIGCGLITCRLLRLRARLRCRPDRG